MIEAIGKVPYCNVRWIVRTPPSRLGKVIRSHLAGDVAVSLT